jgi:hypothetical protein
MHETEMRWQEHAEEFGHDIMGGMEDRDEGIKEAFEDVFSHIEELYHMLEEGRAWDDREDWDDEEECEEDEGHEEDDHEMGFEFDIQIDTDDPEMAEFAQGISETIRAMVMEQMMQMREGDDDEDRADRRRRRSEDKAERGAKRDKRDRKGERRDSERN